MNITKSTSDRLQKLEAFFEAVSKLTLNHDSISWYDGDGYENDYAVVFPSKLGPELEKVDPKWYDEKERRITRLVENRGMSRNAAEIVVTRAMANE